MKRIGFDSLASPEDYYRKRIESDHLLSLDLWLQIELHLYILFLSCCGII